MILKALFVFLVCFIGLNALGQEKTWLDTIKVEAVSLQGCVHVGANQSLLLKNREELNQAIRNDASRERCLDSLSTLDLDSSWLTGIRLITGWCYYPEGLTYNAVVNYGRKECVIYVSYFDPTTPCRALGMYDLWLRLPDFGEEYTVRFEVIPISD